MKIGAHDLDERALSIAEIGVNHEGDFAKAQRLLQLAAASSADAVKFQAYYVGDVRLVSPSADPDRFDRMRRNELSIEQFKTLAREAQSCKVMFLCTCFDPRTVSELNGVLPAFKIASGDLTNDLLLSAVAATGKPILLSTGMSTSNEIRHALEVIARGPQLEALRDRVVLLQCTSSYPCPPEQVQLGAMDDMRRTFGLRVGYSDHTLDSLACEAAVAMGACVVEKHFTDQKSGRNFRDHALSAEPAEFQTLVATIRAIETLRGRTPKAVQEVEAANRLPMRRSIAVARDLPAGTRLSSELLVALRPSSGWPVTDWPALIGRTLVRPLSAGDLIKASDLAKVEE
jgi:N,N'-diacetyllegionaminate synthase